LYTVSVDKSEDLGVELLFCRDIGASKCKVPELLFAALRRGQAFLDSTFCEIFNPIRAALCSSGLREESQCPDYCYFGQSDSECTLTWF